jgi:glucans biosynthesis protein C
MPDEHTAAAQRLDYIDNLRSTMIFLVVAMHAAVTYSHFGRWYYMSPEPIGMADSLAFGMFQSHLQAFFMGLLFLIAGYFTPTSCDRKGFWHFSLDRFVRLGLPALFFVFVVHDAMGHFILHWHGGEPFWPSYVYFVTHGDWVDGSGPMWFVIALLAFSWAYALFRTVLPRARIVPKVPGVAGVLAGGLIAAALSFLVRTVWPVGTAWHNFQFCYFAQYAVLFAVGILARRGDWFSAFSKRDGYRLLWSAAILGPVAWLSLLVGGGALEHGMDAFNGGWHWQSAAFAAWEQVFAVAMCAGLLVLFREKIAGGGKISRLMSANSFGIYVFHSPVLTATSLALASWVVPPLIKAAAATVVAFLATLVVVHFIVRRIPLLNRIF